MAKVTQLGMSENKRTMLETINAYQDQLAKVQLQVEVIEYGLGVLRTTVKEELK